MNYSKTIAVGRLTRAAKLFPAEGEKLAMIACSIAVNLGSTAKPITVYYDVEYRADLAPRMAPYLVKGKVILVEGLVTLHEFLGTDGTKKSSMKMWAKVLQLGADATGITPSQTTPADDDPI